MDFIILTENLGQASLALKERYLDGAIVIRFQSHSKFAEKHTNKIANLFSKESDKNNITNYDLRMSRNSIEIILGKNASKELCYSLCLQIAKHVIWGFEYKAI